MDNWTKIKRKGLGDVPQIPSENIKSPEIAPSDKRISGRTEQLNLKTRKDFKRKLRIIAAEEGCLMIEVVEKALELYEKQHKSSKPTKKLSDYRKIIKRKVKPKKSQPKLTPYSYANFICDNCQNEYKQETAYSYASNLEEFKHSSTYCSNCVN